MRAVVTRVRNASVTIDGTVTGTIDHGLLVLLGVAPEDTPAHAKKLADKICAMRIFQDQAGKMNLNLETVGGSLLVVSQFTLFADCKRGNRPGFTGAARPEIAIPLYEEFMSLCRARGFRVEHGEFGADMQVASVNDGPVTILLDTDELM
ncbi:MAG: D-tyrosyl-tRNA(Tyr) deacylase [Oscillospiraceae bacterium]|nr:D-tyrosyl-tRNA(Tyr) deacylase [Oscillospiraceae bacterium]